jgi:hypothetical protein
MGDEHNYMSISMSRKFTCEYDQMRFYIKYYA